MAAVRRGCLRDGSTAPEHGERTVELVRLGDVLVEQILSGEVAVPVDYRSDRAEFVVVLAGGAVLSVEGERLELDSGDWVFLPPQVPHQLVQVRPGTSWLAVHVSEV